MNIFKLPQVRMTARRHRRTGFTLVEVMIAASISTLVMVIVASLQLLSGRAIKDMYNKTRTRAAQMRALDQIRYQLIRASIASIQVADGNATDGYREIQFEDPMREGAVSRFFFDVNSNTLYFDDDMDDGTDNMDGFEDENDDVEGLAVAKGPIDVRFFPSNFNATIRLWIKSQAYIAAKSYLEEDPDGNVTTKYTVVDEQEGETTVWLRNK